MAAPNMNGRLHLKGFHQNSPASLAFVKVSFVSTRKPESFKGGNGNMISMSISNIIVFHTDHKCKIK